MRKNNVDLSPPPQGLANQVTTLCDRTLRFHLTLLTMVCSVFISSASPFSLFPLSCLLYDFCSAPSVYVASQLSPQALFVCLYKTDDGRKI